MNEFTFVANSESDTDRLGTALAEVLPNGTTIGMYGMLGAGKTRLTQSIAVACGVPRDDVNSPTFVLCQHYHGRRMLYHLDAYRLRDDDEFLELGPDEYFESAGITIVEWADRVRDCLPAQRLEIHIDVVGDTDRTFQIKAQGDSLQSVIDKLKQQMG